MGKLFIIFTVVPLLELFLLVRIGGVLGTWPTLGLVLVTGVAGAFLARREGSRVLRQWREAMTAGQVPAEGVLGGVLILVGGVLLVTPGVVTDAVGLLLLCPPVRRFFAERLGGYLARSSAITFFGVGGRAVSGPGVSSPRPDIIDVAGEVIRESRPDRA